MAMREGHLDEATEGFAAIVRETPSFAEAHLNLGLVLQEQNRFDEAIGSFQKALILKPKLRGANLFLGVAQFRLNQLDKAVIAIQKETAAYPKDPAAWMWLGVVRLAQEKPEEAAEALDKAVKLAPNDLDILYHRGRAHLLVSNNSYGRMFKVDPQSWRVHQVIAQADAEADRHMDAVAEYQAAIKLAPAQPGLHEELGSEYRNMGKTQEAEDAYLRELQIDPNNVLAKYKLGTLNVEKGDAAKGKGLIEAALKEKPGLLHSDYNLGRAEMLLGNDTVAAQLLERATSAPGSDPEVIQQAWYQLGIVYRRLHRMEDAQKAMATFQKLKDEEAESSQKALKRYESQQNRNPPQPPPPPQSPQ
ncbi:MAG TPA: tetratricopeptide repeat protein [Candidatus Acidoferrum sp.]|nr:tetratricopeptide repeat protein [Candidatus Acidoferrum sp.]